MKNYYKYDSNNGKIISVAFSSHEQLNIPVTAGQTIVNLGSTTSLDMQNQYHDLLTNSLQYRPTINCPDNFSVTTTENIIILDLPNPTKVFLDEQEIATVIDGTLELTIPVSGTYVLTLVPEFPYFEKEISVEVT